MSWAKSRAPQTLFGLAFGMPAALTAADLARVVLGASRQVVESLGVFATNGSEKASEGMMALVVDVAI